MQSKKLQVGLALSCILLQFTHVLHAACVCNEEGINTCSQTPCDDRRIIRPKPKYYNPKPEMKLPPVGDNCWCSKLLIQPAALPKTPCTKPNEQPVFHSPPPSYPHYHHPPPHKDDSLPADPVSLSIALQAGEALNVPESKLAYGFVKKPIDGSEKIYFSSVPEENLFKLNNEVITLKKRMRIPPKEEDCLEIEEDEETPNDDAPPYLSYKELGYYPERFKNPRLKEVHPSYVVYHEPKPKPPPRHMNCGFKPGRVTSTCYEDV